MDEQRKRERKEAYCNSQPLSRARPERLALMEVARRSGWQKTHPTDSDGGGGVRGSRSEELRRSRSYQQRTLLSDESREYPSRCR